MKVSVVVPFLNEESFIEQCLTALLGQDLPKPEYDIIFIDNGSQDHSADIVRRYPEILLLEERQPGPYAARNKGLTVASGELVAFTDADCVPAHDWLRHICEGMARTGAGIVQGQWRFVDPKPEALRMCEHYEQTRMAYLNDHSAGRHLFAFGGNMAIRTDVVRALGPFAEQVGAGDTEYLQRYLAQYHHAKVAFLPDMIVTHLKMSGLSRWLHQQVRYGRLMRQVERLTPYRPLSYRERFRIYHACGTAHGYSRWRRFALFGIVAVGAICSATGRLRAALDEWWTFTAGQVGSRTS